VGDPPPLRGLIDTSVVIDLEHVAADDLPAEMAIAAVTQAELAAGPHAAHTPTERARRQDRLQRAEATFEAIPFDAAAARACGRLYAEVASGGRKARGKGALDLLIAATALAADLPLYTRNPSDFEGLQALLELGTVSVAQATD
jgi:predicted nucleic acid-binding protein